MFEYEMPSPRTPTSSARPTRRCPRGRARPARPAAAARSREQGRPRRPVETGPRRPASPAPRDPRTATRVVPARGVRGRTDNRCRASDACAMLGGVETRSVSPVFVGRADELAALTDALARAAAPASRRRCSSAVRPGSARPGSSRSSLAAACRRGAVVALGGCVEIGADGLPFAPFSTALRALRRQLPDELAAAAAGQEDELARLLPELRRDRPAGAARRGGHGPPLRTDRPAAGAARRRPHGRPRPGGPALGRRLHPRTCSPTSSAPCARGRLVVVATYRADDIHRRHPLRPLLAELDRLRTVRRIELRPLQPRPRSAARSPGSSPPSPTPAIGRRRLRTLRRQRLLRRGTRRAATTSGCRTGLTDSLRDLLLVRVEALPGGRPAGRADRRRGRLHRRVPAAAPPSPGSPRTTSSRRCGPPSAPTSSLATPDGDGYRFRHSLVREAVSDDLLPGERSRLNRRYAEALEADPTLVRADERAIRLASYWYHAHDPAKALPAVLDASVEARRRHAYSEQLRLLERAMELWDDRPRGRPGRAAPRRLRRGRTRPAAATRPPPRCATST